MPDYAELKDSVEKRVQFGYSSTDGKFYPIAIDASGIQTVKALLDGIVDFEIGPVPKLVGDVAAASSGDNTLLTVAADKQLKLYAAYLFPGVDITGAVSLKIGSTVVGGGGAVPKAGGEYKLTPADCVLGALGEDLIINLPGAAANTRAIFSYTLV